MKTVRSKIWSKTALNAYAPVGRRIGYKAYFIFPVFFLSLLLSSIAGAHPHIFTYGSVMITFDKKGLAGFQVNWMFDEMFSATMLMDYDTNGNDTLDPGEVELLKRETFDPIREFGYFTHVSIGDDPFQVKYITDFSAEVNNGKLIYRFFIPCHVRAVPSGKELTLSMYDEEFFTCFLLISRPVGFQGDEGITVDYNIEKNRDKAYYFDQVYPDEIRLKFKSK